MSSYFIESEGSMGRWQVNGIGGVRGLRGLRGAEESAASLEIKSAAASAAMVRDLQAIDAARAKLAPAQARVDSAQRRLDALENASPEWFDTYKLNGTAEQNAVYQLGPDTISSVIPSAEQELADATAALQAAKDGLATAQKTSDASSALSVQLNSQYNEAVPREAAARAQRAAMAVSNAQQAAVMQAQDEVVAQQAAQQSAQRKPLYVVGGVVALAALAYLALRK